MGSNLIPFQMYHYDDFLEFLQVSRSASFEACCHDRVAFMHETTWLWRLWDDGMGFQRSQPVTPGDPIGTGWHWPPCVALGRDLCSWIITEAGEKNGHLGELP